MSTAPTGTEITDRDSSTTKVSVEAIANDTTSGAATPPNTLSESESGAVGVEGSLSPPAAAARKTTPSATEIIASDTEGDGGGGSDTGMIVALVVVILVSLTLSRMACFARACSLFDLGVLIRRIVAPFNPVPASTRLGRRLHRRGRYCVAEAQ